MRELLARLWMAYDVFKEGEKRARAAADEADDLFGSHRASTSADAYRIAANWIAWIASGQKV